MNLNNKHINLAKGFFLLKEGRIYDPFINRDGIYDILIKDGKIEQIKSKISKKENFKLINCKNKIITNGFIDLHAHFREPGFEYKENILSGAIAAIKGGYTRVCVMPNTNPVVDNPELVNLIINKSKKLPIDIYPIGAITKGQKGKELAEIGMMVNSGAVAISDDGTPVSNGQLLRMALEYSSKYKIPVINHAEDLDIANEGLMHEGLNSLKLGLQGSPDITESVMVFRDLSIAMYSSGKIHVPHVSSKKSIEIIKNFKNKGLDVTAEVTPHHLCLNDDILLTYNTNAKVAPPIRSEVDRKALINGVKSGVIDCIATDHAPHSIEDKDRDIKNAPCGMIGLESSFGLVYKTLKEEKIKIESIINLFTLNPSKIINIKPNFINEGNLAEINIIDMKKDWVFKKEEIVSKSKNSPIIGMNLLGKVIATFNKGYFSSF